MPPLSNNKFDSIIMIALDFWNQNEFMFKNYILNKLNNIQYDVYNELKSAYELWKALDKKFNVDIVIIKKFIISKFLDFKFVESRIVMS
jgi:hypothetical protein